MLEAELVAFLEWTSDAVFVVTEQGEIRSWNKSAEELFGYSHPKPRTGAAMKSCMARGYRGRRFARVAAAFKVARRVTRNEPLIDPGAKTRKQIALEWPAAIAVSERHQLDFWWMGDKTPVEAVAEIGVPYEILLSGVRLALAENGTEQPNCNNAGTD